MFQIGDSLLFSTVKLYRREWLGIIAAIAGIVKLTGSSQSVVEYQQGDYDTCELGDREP